MCLIFSGDHIAVVVFHIEPAILTGAAFFNISAH